MAEGVRVTGIELQCTEVLLWKYFPSAKEVYYPLLNNDAVIIFSDAEAAAAELNRTHEKWKLQPLPHEVFVDLVAYVDMDLSPIILATPIYINNLTYIGNVDVTFNRFNKQVMLTGKSYQIEWGWNYLIAIRNNQLHIASTFQNGPGEKAAAGKVTKTSPALHSAAGSGTLPPHAALTQAPKSEQPLSQGSGSSAGSDTGLSGGHGNKRSAGRQTSKEDREDHDEKNTTISMGASPQAGGQDTTPTKPGQSIKVLHYPHPEGKEAGAEKTHPSEEKSSQFFDIGQYGDDYGGDGSKETPHSSHKEPAHDNVEGAFGGSEEASSTSLSQVDDFALQTGALAELSQKTFEIGQEMNMNLKLKIYVGDITKSQTSAIVNPTNSVLDSMAWGGVASVIARAGGKEMEMDCYRLYRKWGELATGQLVKTKAYGRLSHLQCVIHTVGSGFINKEPERGVYELAETFMNCMASADDNWNLESLAFPFIGTGMFGLSVDNCVLALVTAMLVYGYTRKVVQHGRHVTFQPILQEVHFINTDINNVVEAILIAQELLSTETFMSAIQRLKQGRKKYHHLSCSFCAYGTGRCRTRGAVKESEYYAAYGISNPPKHDTQPHSLSSQSSEETDQGHTDGHKAESAGHYTKDTGEFYPEELDLMGDVEAQITDHFATEYVSFLDPDNKDQGHDPQTKNTETKDEEEGNFDFPGSGDDAELRGEEAERDIDSEAEGGPSQHQSLPSVDATELNSSSDLGQTAEPRPRSGSFDETRSLQPSFAGRAAPASCRRSLSLDDQSADSTDNEVENLAGEETQASSPTEDAEKGAGYAGTAVDDSSSDSEGEDTENNCPVCLEPIRDKKKLPCGHKFCTICVDLAMAVQPKCPKCQRNFGITEGNQPREGTMTYTVSRHTSLPGYEGSGTIIVKYFIPAGVQEACHPVPGKRYGSLQQTAYLPDNMEGNEILKMLRKAFDSRLTFTLRANGAIAWNNIHHKTATHGGPDEFGYPDPGYLKQVREDLAAKGILSP